jgi:hypothetical protein
MKKPRTSQAGTGGMQQLQNLGVPKQGETLIGSIRGQGLEAVYLQNKAQGFYGPVTYKEALANIERAIFKNYPEDKLTEDEQDLIFKELGWVFCETPKGELPHLRSFGLEGGALMHVCSDQQCGQWLKATDNHRLR